MRLNNALPEHHLYFPSSGMPKVCTNMARKSPTVAVSPWLCKASCNSFLNTLRVTFALCLSNVLYEGLCNFCCHLTKAAAESNATNAMIEEGSAAGPGFWETSELEHGPLLTLSEGQTE